MIYFFGLVFLFYSVCSACGSAIQFLHFLIFKNDKTMHLVFSFVLLLVSLILSAASNYFGLHSLQFLPGVVFLFTLTLFLVGWFVELETNYI